MITIEITDNHDLLARLLAEFVRQGIVANVTVTGFGVNRWKAVIELTGGH